MTGVFFDIDDTLYSRRALLLRAARETAKHPEAVCGREGTMQEDLFMKIFYQHSDENYPLVVSGQITPWQSNVWRYVRTLQDLGEEVCDEDGEAFARRYTYLQEHIEMSDELRCTLEELAGMSDVRLGVITNGASEFQWKKACTLGLDRLIGRGDILVSGDLGISKPEQGIFLEGAKRFGLAPQDLWMVGDSIRHDIEGAKKLGWHTIWIRRNAEDPADVQSDLVVNNEAELCRSLRNIL